MSDATVGGWAATLGLIVGMIALDLWYARRNPRAIGLGEAAVWSVLYVSVALGFGVVFGIVAGWDLGAQYFAGYVVEKSLSVDNLFVFMIIMSTFAVPAPQQPRLLMIGIIGALVLRAAFIAAGAAMLETFSFTYVLFGLAITVTAVQLFRHRNRDPNVEDNALVAAARRFLPVSERYDGPRLLTRRSGRRALTPLTLALLAIASSDILFAFDSIPAVFGVTQDPYIVFTANAFALLGLRSLFFLISGLLHRLIYLSTGLALILAFIGVKLVLHFAHLHHDGVPEISVGLSLGVIALVLATTAIASLIKARRDPAARAHAGAAVERSTPARERRSTRKHAIPSAGAVDREAPGHVTRG
jgi:tellurite resistance protein TerC